MYRPPRLSHKNVLCKPAVCGLATEPGTRRIQNEDFRVRGREHLRHAVNRPSDVEPALEELLNYSRLFRRNRGGVAAVASNFDEFEDRPVKSARKGGSWLSGASCSSLPH